MSKSLTQFLIIIALTSGCGTKNDDSPLMLGEFTSNQTISLVKLQLAKKGLDWVVIYDVMNKGTKAPYRTCSTKVAKFSHLNCTGELRLDFYNDRLMSTCFYPDRPDEYLRKLESSLGRSIKRPNGAAATEETTLSG